MTHCYTIATFSADELFDSISANTVDMITPPDVAKAGDICGFVMDLKSQSGRNSYALSYPVDEFLISDGAGRVVKTGFRALQKDRKVDAALLAMELNLMRVAHMTCIQQILDSIDDADGDLYSRLICLPAVGMIHQDQYEDILDIDFDDPDYTQLEIDRGFTLLRRAHDSNHQGLQYCTARCAISHFSRTWRRSRKIIPTRLQCASMSLLERQNENSGPPGAGSLSLGLSPQRQPVPATRQLSALPGDTYRRPRNWHALSRTQAPPDLSSWPGTG